MSTLSQKSLNHKFAGVSTAIVTPFGADDSIDLDAFSKLVELQTEAKVSGVIISGTTGESPTLTEKEKMTLLETALRASAGKINVIAGTGSNCTRKTIEETRLASANGADAVLVVVPYYNKPSQEGLKSHFLKIADAAQKPVILYNVPGRTVVSLAAKTVQQLAQHPNIIGIKEATGNIAFLKELRLLISPEKPDFLYLSGDDCSYLPFLQEGGHGIISVASNIAPKLLAEIMDLHLIGKKTDAKRLFDKSKDFFDALFIEANPSPIKFLMERFLKIPGRLRLPMTGVSEENSKKILDASKDISDYFIK